MEVMMMKRMNYIRNTIDLHNPRDVTSKIRQAANVKRDERIIELWKKDLEYPKINELIEDLKKQKLKEPRNDFIDSKDNLDVS